jgi:hypothetical protein
LTSDDSIVFSFSIERTGVAEHKLSHLLLKFSEVEKGIVLLSAFAVDNKQENKKEFKMFCVARNREKFKQLIESEGLHATELEGFVITSTPTGVLRAGHKNVLSGIDISAFVYSANRRVGKKASTYYVKNQLAGTPL